MALTVTPGRLRPEGPGFKPANLEEFVETTRLSGFGSDAFGGDISFVISTTEPPATSTRSRGTLWFARGIGRLYKWDDAWTHSTESGISDAAFWVAISDRKEHVVRWTPTVQSDFPGSFPMLGLLHEASPVTNGNGVLRPIPALGVPNPIVTVRMVPLTSTTVSTDLAEEFFTACDLGYCNARVYSGATGPAFGVIDTPNFGLLQSLGSPYNNDRCYCAHIVASTETFGEENVQVFMLASGRRAGTA